jgi:hypothetical protein
MRAIRQMSSFSSENSRICFEKGQIIFRKSPFFTPERTPMCRSHNDTVAELGARKDQKNALPRVEYLI